MRIITMRVTLNICRTPVTVDADAPLYAAHRPLTADLDLSIDDDRDPVINAEYDATRKGPGHGS